MSDMLVIINVQLSHMLAQPKARDLAQNCRPGGFM